MTNEAVRTRKHSEQWTELESIMLLGRASKKRAWNFSNSSGTKSEQGFTLAKVPVQHETTKEYICRFYNEEQDACLILDCQSLTGGRFLIFGVAWDETSHKERLIGGCVISCKAAV